MQLNCLGQSTFSFKFPGISGFRCKVHFHRWTLTCGNATTTTVQLTFGLGPAANRKCQAVTYIHSKEARKLQRLESKKKGKRCGSAFGNLAKTKKPADSSKLLNPVTGNYFQNCQEQDDIHFALQNCSQASARCSLGLGRIAAKRCHTAS